MVGMTVYERTSKDLLEELRARRWSDAAIGKELDVTGVTVWRWRKGDRGIKMEHIVRLALQHLLERP